jgi:hypothetical protein
MGLNISSSVAQNIASAIASSVSSGKITFSDSSEITVDTVFTATGVYESGQYAYCMLDMDFYVSEQKTITTLTYYDSSNNIVIVRDELSIDTYVGNNTIREIIKIQYQL